VEESTSEESRCKQGSERRIVHNDLACQLGMQAHCASESEEYLPYAVSRCQQPASLALVSFLESQVILAQMGPNLLSMARQPVGRHPEMHHEHQYSWLLLQYFVMYALEL
jgi:hypothetical protein